MDGSFRQPGQVRKEAAVTRLIRVAISISHHGDKIMTYSKTSSSYRVFARKYRPKTLSDLVGQEVLVRTLTNAIRLDRLPHAFVLTGVRGVGKTSTARIIAKAMNCTGRETAPTEDPCGRCENCIAITEDRHVDVLEMDAASHTGVDDIRDLIDTLPYAPVVGKYKVYIIDEVHMLSRNAFNALLKTLEEPPPHVMFVFATTEVRRIPVTVLSRCMRFDLRRVESDLLAHHLNEICNSESIAIETAAVGVIARASEGSVRDALSLLDQARNLTDQKINADNVREMLGLADRSRTYDLFEKVMKGDVASALDLITELIFSGAEPESVLEDLMVLTHWVTRLKVVPNTAVDSMVVEIDRKRGTLLSERLSMAALTRAWQMLLKGLGEVRTAPSPVHAVEMVILRLSYAANLPVPAELVRKLQASDHLSGSSSLRDNTPEKMSFEAGDSEAILPKVMTDNEGFTDSFQVKSDEKQANPSLAAKKRVPEDRYLPDFRSVISLVRGMREPILEAQLLNNVHLVNFAPCNIALRLDTKADRDLPKRLSELLTSVTGEKWLVSESEAQGDATLSQQAIAIKNERQSEIKSHPLVKQALDLFPGAQIREIREVKPEKSGTDFEGN